MSRRRDSTTRTLVERLWKPVLTATLIVCSLVFTGRGVKHMFGLESWLNDLSLLVYNRIDRNYHMRSRLSALKTDKRALEEVARSTLGFVRSDEIVYVFPPPLEENRSTGIRAH